MEIENSTVNNELFCLTPKMSIVKRKKNNEEIEENLFRNRKAILVVALFIFLFLNVIQTLICNFYIFPFRFGSQCFIRSVQLINSMSEFAAHSINSHLRAWLRYYVTVKSVKW